MFYKCLLPVYNKRKYKKAAAPEGMAAKQQELNGFMQVTGMDAVRAEHCGEAFLQAVTEWKAEQKAVF
ncbi:MAG: hypothetical protein IJ412_06950 [Oscillospiraceae bacterium]|nr:hypothetical protein [Oscillospiraceae bacterium]